MGTDAIVVIGVRPEDPAQMRLAQDQNVVEAFSSDQADEPFCKGERGAVDRSRMRIARTLLLTIAP